MIPQVIDRDSALESRIEAEYLAMCKAYHEGRASKARGHAEEMQRLCGMRSRDCVERLESEMGLK